MKHLKRVCLILGVLLVACTTPKSGPAVTPVQPSGAQTSSGGIPELAQVEREVGVPVQVIARDSLPQGIAGNIVFFRYKKGPECVIGYTFTNAVESLGFVGGRIDWGQHCNELRPVGFGGPASYGSDLTVLFGDVNNPKVTRVSVTLMNNDTLQADVQNGVWWVLLTDRNGAPKARQWDGFDAEGKVLYSGH